VQTTGSNHCREQKLFSHSQNISLLCDRFLLAQHKTQVDAGGAHSVTQLGTDALISNPKAKFSWLHDAKACQRRPTWLLQISQSMSSEDQKGPFFLVN
jgi:hypothetical protein